jgi:single-stranded DNA-binding protein
MYGHAGFQFVGTCSKDVELSHLANGSQRARISLVINTPEKQQDGSWKERATWVTLAVFGPRAESKTVLGCLKGATVFVQGEVHSYQKEIEGKKYTMHNFKPDVIRLCDRSGNPSGSDDDGYQEMR